MAAVANLMAALAFLLPAADAPLKLQTPPQLRKDTDALVRIAEADTPAKQRINRQLAVMDNSWRALIDECKSWEGGGSTDRQVIVRRAGPDYLALTVSYDIYCGGNHPSRATESFIYDLKTGAPVNWATLLPKAGLKAVPGNMLELRLSYFTSPSLREQYRAAMRASWRNDRQMMQDCLPVISDMDLAFSAYPEKSGKLVIYPVTLPHVVQACGDPWTLSVADLRRMGADPRLIAMVATPPP